LPIYEYECNQCGNRFEIIQKFSDKAKRKCEKCNGKLRKLIAPPALMFKGTGWYVTDYSSKGKEPQSKESSEKAKSEKDKGGKEKIGKETSRKEAGEKGTPDSIKATSKEKSSSEKK